MLYLFNSIQMETEIKQVTNCGYCEKQLHGRKGKLFCDVNCKNNFNSRIRAKSREQENELFPIPIQKIKNNHRILSKHYLVRLQKETEITVKKEELRALGFDHRYCTGATLESNRDLWKCCFDFCWKEEMNWLTIRFNAEMNKQYSY